MECDSVLRSNIVNYDGNSEAMVTFEDVLEQGRFAGALDVGQLVKARGNET